MMTSSPVEMHDDVLTGLSCSCVGVEMVDSGIVHSVSVQEAHSLVYSSSYC